MPAKILVVDDKISIRRLMRNTLERAGYAVLEAMNAREALAVAALEQPGATLLDLGLPDRDGLSLVPLLRRDGGAVIIVSARDATGEKVEALDLGAVDFVTKPFDTEELLARLRVALRYHDASASMQKVILLGNLSIDLETRSVRRGGVEVHLTRKEHDVLDMLARHIGRVVTHDRIIAAAWGRDDDPHVEYLRIVIRNVRQKLEFPEPVGSVIANELGVAYRLLDSMSSA